ncbi:MAG: hypothetical protein ACT4PS_05620, partial [Betaproteobacteria bacterium]
MPLKTSLPTPQALDTRSQDCPLCGNDAEYYFVDGQTRKHFLCSNCTQFQISVDAEGRLKCGPADWRSNLSQLSRAHPQGATLVIVRPAAASAAQDSTAPAHEYVENSQLP